MTVLGRGLIFQLVLDRERQTDRQTGRQTGRQAERRSYIMNARTYVHAPSTPLITWTGKQTNRPLPSESRNRDSNSFNWFDFSV